MNMSKSMAVGRRKEDRGISIGSWKDIEMNAVRGGGNTRLQRVFKAGLRG